MRYGKLTDSCIELAPNPLVIDGRHIFTNDPDIFKQQGYLPIETTPAPECPEGYQLTYKWAEVNGSIVRIWEPEENPPEEPEQT